MLLRVNVIDVGMSESPLPKGLASKSRDELPNDPEVLKDLLFAALTAVEDLENKLKWFKRMMWGRKSERATDVPEGQADLFPDGTERVEAEGDTSDTSDASDSTSGDAIPPKMPSGTRRTRRGGKRTKKRGTFDQMIPKGLAERVTTITLQEAGCTCGVCGGPLDLLGTDRRRRIDYVPGHFVVDVTVVESGVCPLHRDAGIVTPEGPEHAIPGSVLGDELLGKIVVDKFADNIPLNRQAKRCYRAG